MPGLDNVSATYRGFLVEIIGNIPYRSERRRMADERAAAAILDEGAMEDVMERSTVGGIAKSVGG